MFAKPGVSRPERLRHHAPTGTIDVMPRNRLCWISVIVLAVVVGAVRLAWPWLARWTTVAVWRQTAPGIEVAVLRGHTFFDGVAVTAVRANPARYALRVVDAHQRIRGAGAEASDVCPPDGAAINASYFAEDLTPIGAVVTDGIPMYAPRGQREGGWGFVLAQRGRVVLCAATTRLPAGVTQAIECKPRLVVDGSIPRFKQQPPARRSGVGMDAQGRVIFAAADGPLTLEQWAACLHTQLGCVDALNLDGGPSTQLALRGTAPIIVAGGSLVPTFLVIAPRAASEAPAGLRPAGESSRSARE